MILHAIDLRCVGPFCEDLRLGPFRRGLNIIAAPNESGKTTALRAAARGLFDRHTTKSEELKAMQPVGTALAPRIAVEFETAEGHFRIEKNFLQTPSSVLQRRHGEKWELLAEGDAADSRVQELLESSLPGRGATKPEHWGLLGFLWARQGEPATWPSLTEGETGMKIRSRLVRVELDPVIERLRARLATMAGEIMTSTGRAKTGGPLEAAEVELTELEAELAALKKKREEIESSQQRHQQAAAAVTQLEREHSDRAAAARQSKEEAEAAVRIGVELEAREADFAMARERLQLVTKDAEKLANCTAALGAAQRELAKAETVAVQVDHHLAELRRRIDQEQATRPERERQLATLRAAHQRSLLLLKLHQAATASAALARQCAEAETSAATLVGLREKLARLPALTAAKVARLQELADRVMTLQAQVEAVGLTVELTPANDAQVVVESRTEKLSADETLTLRSPQTLELALPGWGRITIRSGAEEGRNAAGELEGARAKLAAALEAADVASLEAAGEALSALIALKAELKTAEANHTRQLGEHTSFDALRETAAAAARRLESLTSTIQPTEAEQAATSTELESAEARVTTAVPPAEEALREMDAALARLRKEERDTIDRARKSSEIVSDLRIQVRTLEAQINDLTARHSTGLAAAKSQAEIGFVEAEARLKVTKQSLPPDFAQLPERNRRAAIALQQVLNDLQARRAERDTARGALEMLGGQGIHTRETSLEEKKVEVELRRDAARNRGWAARLAHDLIEHRKQAATRAVLSPLEERLTAAFAHLTAQSERRVFLDEHLQIAGLGRSRDAIHSFDLLSQGAREQLLLCLRLAVAQELAVDEPQTLILDDVLVNTDSVRQERVLDLLGTLTADLQILILTCHADRYRGVGHTVAFASTG